MQPTDLRNRTRHLFALVAIAGALAVAGCTPQPEDTVTIVARQDTVAPYAVVSLRLATAEQPGGCALTVDPPAVRIWSAPHPPLAHKPVQVLWQVVCDARAADCPGEGDTLVVHPKPGSSPTLFDPDPAHRGRLEIPGSSNAIASGKADPEEVEGLPEGKKAEVQELAVVPPRGRLGRWDYSVSLERDGKVVCEVDPTVWVEKDG